MKDCGSWTLTDKLEREDCGCIGLKKSSLSEGAGTYSCYGVSLGVSQER